MDFYVHLPDVTGTGQLGDYYLKRSGMEDMPKEWKAGIFLPFLACILPKQSMVFSPITAIW